MFNKKFKWPVGQTVLIFNVVIYGTAGILFGWNRAMFSLLTYFIASKVIDMVETGFDKAKAAMIITNECEEIAQQIYEKLGRTVTILEGEGNQKTAEIGEWFVVLTMTIDYDRFIIFRRGHGHCHKS